MSWLPGSAAVQRGPSRAGGVGDPPLEASTWVCVNIERLPSWTTWKKEDRPVSVYLPIGWEASYSQPPLLSLSSHEKTTRSARGLGQPSAPAQGNDRFHRCESSIVAPKGPNPSTTCLVGLTMSGRRFCSGGKSPVFFLFFFFFRCCSTHLSHGCLTHRVSSSPIRPETGGDHAANAQGC